MPRFLFLIFFGLVMGVPAAAHTGSTAYIDINTEAQAFSATWRISLRDLDLLTDVDTDRNGTLTWDEVQAHAATVQALAVESLRFTAQGQTCALSAQALQRVPDAEHDFALITLAGACPEATQLTYTAFAGVDDNHRALVRINQAGEPQVLAPAATLALSAQEEAPHSFGQFFRTGVAHILEGIDHLLFLVALMLPSVLVRVDQVWRARTDRREALMNIVWLATAFTVAHSITLGLAAFDVVRFSPGLIEPLVAATVLAAALNNIRPVVTQHLTWIAFAFGLIHGFAFAEVLAPLHLARTDLALALLGFNLGVEAGQLAVVVVSFALLAAAARWRGYPRWVLQGGSGVVAVLACVWIVERVFDIALISQ